MPIHAQTIEPGERIPWFSVSTLDGDTIDTKSLIEAATPTESGSRVCVVAFLSPHSPYVREIATELGHSFVVYKQAGVAIVAINPNDPRSYPADSVEGMCRQRDEHGWDFPYGIDPRQSTAKMFRASCTPEFFVYRDQRLVDHGAFTPGPNDVHPEASSSLTRLDDIVLAAVAGDRVRPGLASAFGCSTKWSEGREPAYLLRGT